MSERPSLPNKDEHPVKHYLVAEEVILQAARWLAPTDISDTATADTLAGPEPVGPDPTEYQSLLQNFPIGR